MTKAMEPIFRCGAAKQDNAKPLGMWIMYPLSMSTPFIEEGFVVGDAFALERSDRGWIYSRDFT